MCHQIFFQDDKLGQGDLDRKAQTSLVTPVGLAQPVVLAQRPVPPLPPEDGPQGWK